MTGWMLVLGRAGRADRARLARRESGLSPAVVLIATLGAWIAWRKPRKFLRRTRRLGQPFTFDEKLIIAMIAAAIVLRWIHTALLALHRLRRALGLWLSRPPVFSGRADPAARSIIIRRFCSSSTPMFRFLIGAINDYAARMVLPTLHIGGIFGGISSRPKAAEPTGWVVRRRFVEPASFCRAPVDHRRPGDHAGLQFYAGRGLFLCAPGPSKKTSALRSAGCTCWPGSCSASACSPNQRQGHSFGACCCC